MSDAFLLMIAGMLRRLSGWDRRSNYEKTVLAHRARHALAAAISPLPLPLPWIMRLARTDKHWPHVPGGHRYGTAYAEALGAMRYRRIRMVEIGVGGFDDDIGGRSLVAWRAYFPRADILACDLIDKPELSAGRTRFLRTDQGNAADLAAVAAHGPFDLVVDDGSHQSAHQWLTFSVLFSALKEGGLYIVEDVQTSFWNRDVGGASWDGARPNSPAFTETCMGRMLELAKHVNHAEFLDLADADPELLPFARQIRRLAFEHNLILITKGRNDNPSNRIRWENAAVPAACALG